MRHFILMLILLFTFLPSATAQTPPTVSVIASPYELEIVRIWETKEADGETPDEDIFLVFETILHNHGDDDRCIKRSAFRLSWSSWGAEPSAMDHVRDEYYPDRDYPGPFRGQCIDANSKQDSLLVFDAPQNMTRAVIEFSMGDEETTVTLWLERQSDGEYQFGEGEKPVTTTLQTAYENVEGVHFIRLVSQFGNTVTLHLDVEPGFVTLPMAQSLREIAIATLGNEDIEFTAILWDGKSAPVDYSKWTYNDEWLVTPLSFEPETYGE